MTRRGRVDDGIRHAAAPWPRRRSRGRAGRAAGPGPLGPLPQRPGGLAAVEGQQRDEVEQQQHDVERADEPEEEEDLVADRAQPAEAVDPMTASPAIRPTPTTDIGLSAGSRRPLTLDLTALTTALRQAARCTLPVPAICWPTKPGHRGEWLGLDDDVRRRADPEEAGVEVGRLAVGVQDRRARPRCRRALVCWTGVAVSVCGRPGRSTTIGRRSPMRGRMSLPTSAESATGVPSMLTMTSPGCSPAGRPASSARWPGRPSWRVACEAGTTHSLTEATTAPGRSVGTPCTVRTRRT